MAAWSHKPSTAANTNIYQYACSPCLFILMMKNLPTGPYLFKQQLYASQKKKELKCTKPKKGKQKSQKMEILWIWKRNDKHKTTLMWFWIATLTKATRLMLAHWRSNFRAEGKYHLRKLLYNQTHLLILLAIESAIFYSLAL